MLKVQIDSFGYTPEKTILKNVVFALATGAHLAVLGESGSGKSTLLHLLYGLMDLPNGQMSWNDSPIFGPSHYLVPGIPEFKLVAQDANVMPFTSALDNVREYLPRTDKEADTQRATELLNIVGLTPYLNSPVKNLSGGQKQRIAIAKSLAKEPELLLLDEPFSHIDQHRKSVLRKRVYSYLKSKNISCVTATHDAYEALSFADQILILKDGKTTFYGTPQELYYGIDNAYHAGFFGEINAISLNSGSKAVSYLFPHQLELSKTQGDIKAKVIQSYFKGSHYLIEATWEGQLVYVNYSRALKEQTTIYLKLPKKA